MNAEQRFRVYNKCKHDIGVNTINGLSLNIKAGSFQLLTVNDILYIESICRTNKFFSARMLVIVDDTGKEINLEDIGLAKDESVQEHLSDDEIFAMLKKSNKQIEAWINNIEDPAELHSIFMVAKNADISSSKLKILHDKMPDKDWLEE